MKSASGAKMERSEQLAPVASAELTTRILIDLLVKQLTELVARLATASGLRAPLAHLGDQVFLDLASRIEAEGVSRKVAADMLGMTLRTYQRQLQRLATPRGAPRPTLWHAVLDHLERYGPVKRKDLRSHFNRAPRTVLASVLEDLITSGIAYKTGHRDEVELGLTRQWNLIVSRQRSALSSILMVVIHRAGACTDEQLALKLAVPAAALKAPLAELVATGRVTSTGSHPQIYHSPKPDSSLDLPGECEAAHLDQFHAIVRTIALEFGTASLRTPRQEAVGGDVCPPLRHETSASRRDDSPPMATASVGARTPNVV